ncbi:MAG: NapC/NirT family cytochrome c [bacterium]
MKPAGGLGSFLRSLSAHPVGFVGVLVTTTSAVLLGTLIFLDLVHMIHSPYLGVLTFLVLPGIFVAGLALIPIGRWLQSRRKGGAVVVDLNEPRHQNKLILVFVLTVVNVTVLSVATYRAVEFSDSNTFCGKLCHEVMEPEYTAYQGSPHSRVDCVACHIGSGAGFFVRYKINGLSQVIAVMTNSYSRPIETPVANLRPARETCEQCHWPEKFHGDKLIVKSHFGEDETNTRYDTVMLLKVGGGSSESGFSSGIHKHMSLDNTVRFISSDRERQDIVWMEVERKSGEKIVYTKAGVEISDSLLTYGEKHQLDCIDCHNRPTHAYQSPERALDNAFIEGQLDPGLPRLKRLGLDLLTAEYESKDDALRAIPAKVDEFYRENYAEVYTQFRSSIERAGITVRDIYARNIFPSMNITWNTYPDHIGHLDGGGCFRCHAGEHTTADGKEVTSSCDACHTLLAEEEEQPPILHALFPNRDQPVAR